jgi:hypothetical protein
LSGKCYEKRSLAEYEEKFASSMYHQDCLFTSDCFYTIYGTRTPIDIISKLNEKYLTKHQHENASAREKMLSNLKMTDLYDAETHYQDYLNSLEGASIHGKQERF